MRGGGMRSAPTGEVLARDLGRLARVVIQQVKVVAAVALVEHAAVCEEQRSLVSGAQVARAGPDACDTKAAQKQQGQQQGRQWQQQGNRLIVLSCMARESMHLGHIMVS